MQVFIVTATLAHGNKTTVHREAFFTMAGAEKARNTMRDMHGPLAFDGDIVYRFHQCYVRDLEETPEYKELWQSFEDSAVAAAGKGQEVGNLSNQLDKAKRWLNFLLQQEGLTDEKRNKEIIEEGLSNRTEPWRDSLEFPDPGDGHTV
jgi:hypothetical protein